MSSLKRNLRHMLNLRRRQPVSRLATIFKHHALKSLLPLNLVPQLSAPLNTMVRFTVLTLVAIGHLLICQMSLLLLNVCW